MIVCSGRLNLAKGKFDLDNYEDRRIFREVFASLERHTLIASAMKRNCDNCCKFILSGMHNFVWSCNTDSYALLFCEDCYNIFEEALKNTAKIEDRILIRIEEDNFTISNPVDKKVVNKNLIRFEDL